MKTKWTKGPWSITGTGIIISAIKKIRYIICQPKLYVNVPANSSEMKANINLIAASPELYDACKWAKWLLETKEIKVHLEEKYPKWGDPEEVMRIIDSAMKKARGES